MTFSFSDLRWFHFVAMGSPCAIGFVPEDDAPQDFEAVVLDWLGNFETRYSRYRPASLISEINDNAGGAWIEVDPETESILSLVDRAFHLTGGLFDPSALPLIQLWDYKRKREGVPTAEEVARARGLVGWERLERGSGRVRLPEKGMGIDVGGICKEYAVDRVVELAVALGLNHLIVDLGQDVRVHGGPSTDGPWRVGLENPFRPGVSWATLGMSDGAVATSGAYYRNSTIEGNRFGHILDPRTGRPVDARHCSATVVAANCAVAGVLSTAAYILGPEEGMRLIRDHGQAEGCLITNTDCFSTKGFQSRLID